MIAIGRKIGNYEYEEIAPNVLQTMPISKSMLNNRYFYRGFFDKKLLSWRALSG